MEVFLFYIFKVSGIMAIFYCAYQLFLKKETFFRFNRYFLMCGLVVAILLPCITIYNYVEIDASVVNSIESIGVQTYGQETLPVENTDWMGVLFKLYLIGVGFFAIKFMLQLVSLFKMIRRHTVTQFGGYRYVECDQDIAPFSFFNHIFYNPSLYGESELSTIIKHEIVHSSQRHSIDVIAGHLITIATWINPISWLYQSSIKQNLEFLADKDAVQDIPSAKSYQYTLLKVSGNKFCPPIVNTFYNSLIKKRIVMLNKSKSNKMNISKSVLVIPALALFLVSFNTKEVLIPVSSDSNLSWVYETPGETIEIIIDKNTTKDELKKIKKDLAKKGVDFSYKVEHNNDNEITSISIDFEVKNNGSKTKGSSSFNNDGGPIDPILISYDADSNSISLGNVKSGHINIHEDEDHTVWIHSDDDGEHKTVEIIEEDGKETIKVNGKEVTREAYEAMKDEDGEHKKIVKIRKSKGDGSNAIFISHDADDDKEIHKKQVGIKQSKDGDHNVFIMKDSDDEDGDIINIDGGKGFFFIDTDGDENPLYIIDGKESTKEAVKKMDSSEIEKIEVFKGDKAKEKYGDKAKNGVVEITTKKEND